MEERFGGWMIGEMEACPLPEKAATAFSEALGHWVGAVYIPVLYVGHQLVAGMNYMIICKQTMMTACQDEHIVKMIIHKPLVGDATIIEIKTII